MPDLKNRRGIERETAYGLSAVLHRLRRRLADMGVDRAASRSDAEWGEDEAEIAAALYLLLRRPWSASFDYMAGSIGMTPRAGELNAAYDAWALPRAGELAAKMVDTNRKIVSTLADKPAEERTYSERKLMPLTADYRIDRAAVTLTTTAASKAENEAAKMYFAARGITLSPYWQTERDERVCPVCGPLNDKPGNVWRLDYPIGPPAHVNCRCWLDWRTV